MNVDPQTQSHLDALDHHRIGYMLFHTCQEIEIDTYGPQGPTTVSCTLTLAGAYLPGESSPRTPDELVQWLQDYQGTQGIAS